MTPAADAIRVRGGAYAHRSRIVPITGPAAREALAAWCQERAGVTAPDPALFMSRRKQRITLRTVEHVMRQIGASPGTFRNTHAAELADDGMPSGEIAELLGHARAETVRPFASGTHRAGREISGGSGQLQLAAGVR